MALKMISTSAAAERNGVTARYISKLCAEGRVKGAERIGRDWLVPATFKWEPLKRGPKQKK